MEEKFYYIATKNDKGKYLVYETESFRLSEIDIINLIKICIIEARSKAIGRKILNIYRDSSETNMKEAEKKLNMIGINNEKEKPNTTTKPSRK